VGDLRAFDAQALVGEKANRTTADEQDHDLQSPDRHPPRETVERGTLRLAAFVANQKDEAHTTLTYARAAGRTLVPTCLLRFDRWATRALRDLDAEGIAVAATFRLDFYACDHRADETAVLSTQPCRAHRPC